MNFSFIETYKRLANHGVSEENLVNATIEDMKNKGFAVRLKSVIFFINLMLMD
jgi:hypothetical protein